MQTQPPLPQAQAAMEKCAGFVRFLIHAVVTATLSYRIPHALGGLITQRIIEFRQKMEKLTARLAAGTYKPRPKTGPRKTLAQRTPAQPGKPPARRNWLGTLLPDANYYRAALDQLLREPDLAALVEAAPAETVRPLRSLCFMLGLPAPDILKLPRKPRQPKARPATPVAQPAAPEAMTGSEILMSPSAPEHLRAQWAKPKGSISNRLYRKRRPPRAKNSA